MKAVIPAAGENSRFWPLGQDKHKCMYEVGAGKPVLSYVLKEIQKAGIEEVILIIRENDDSIKKTLGTGAPDNLKIEYVRQPEAQGMGSALLQAKELLFPNDSFWIVNPNHVNCSGMLASIMEKFENGRKEAVLVGQKTPNPSNFGILELGTTGQVLSIEEKPADPKSNVRVVGIYRLPGMFLDILGKHRGHYSFESALQELITTQQRVWCLEMADDFPLFSLKYPWDLLAINRFITERELEPIFNFDKASGVAVEGQVFLGNGIRFLGSASIKGPCYIGNNVTIGDSVVIRDHTLVGDGCVIGCKTEIKNSMLGHNVHTHDNFIGDSVIGDGGRFGAGTIVANRKVNRSVIKSLVKGKKVETGLSSFGVIVGPGTKMGINCSLMPGIKIGRNCIIGPHTLVSEDIEDSHSYYATFQTNKKTIRQGG